MRKSMFTLAGMALVVALLATSAPVAAKATVVRDPVLWIDGDLYRTVLTPTVLPDAAPAESFDILYNFDGSGLSGQRSVGEAAPGDPGYNGGRWMVFAVAFTALGMSIHDANGDGMVNFELTSTAQVEAHMALGHLLISAEPVALFVCPVLPVK